MWKSTKHGPKQEIWFLRWIYLGHPVLFCLGAWKLPQVSLMCHQTSRGTGFAKESKGTLGALDSKMNPFGESCPFLSWCVETSSEVPKVCIMRKRIFQIICSRIGAFMFMCLCKNQFELCSSFIGFMLNQPSCALNSILSSSAD